MNSQCHVVWKASWILISWLLQKPADLDLHCFHLSLYLVSYCFFKEFMYSDQQRKCKLGSLCITCFLGQVKFSLDKYIMAIYLSLGKYKILLFAIHLPTEKAHTF